MGPDQWVALFARQVVGEFSRLLGRAVHAVGRGFYAVDGNVVGAEYAFDAIARFVAAAQRHTERGTRVALVIGERGGIALRVTQGRRTRVRRLPYRSTAQRPAQVA